MADVARGEQIKALRKQRERESENGKLTQPMVAEAVGVTLRAYQDWESSTEARPKGIETPHARKLATVLGVAYEDVARREDEPEAAPLTEEFSQLRAQLDRIEATQAVILETLQLLSVDPESVVPSDEPARKRRGKTPRTATA